MTRHYKLSFCVTSATQHPLPAATLVVLTRGSFQSEPSGINQKIRERANTDFLKSNSEAIPLRSKNNFPELRDSQKHS